MEFCRLEMHLIKLRPKLSFDRLTKPASLFTIEILFLLRFRSCKLAISGRSMYSIRLPYRFSVFKLWSLSRPESSLTLLSLRSRCSSACSLSRFLTCLIWFLAKLTVLSLSRLLPGTQKLLISISLFDERSSV